MNPIPDDPIIACMERTGFPPWMQEEIEDEDAEDEDPDEKEDT